MNLYIKEEISEDGQVLYAVYDGNTWLAYFKDPNDADVYIEWKEEQLKQQQFKLPDR